MRYVTALTIAGSDSCAGAGIQADIKTMAALGVYATTVITAVTAQNTLGVTAVEAVSPSMVAAQIDAVMCDVRPAAVKIGMVNDAATVHAIASTLGKYTIEHLVVDPIMLSTSGSHLMAADALQAFTNELIPMATILTPNIPEAEVLATAGADSGCALSNTDAMGEVLSRRWAAYILIKGGHGDKCDRLYKDGSLVREYRTADVDTVNTHGTGCTLSSAIASYLAKGHTVEEAVGKAKDYVTLALIAGKDRTLGAGHGPLNHFLWRDEPGDA